ncbi:hypothetical protein BH10PSE6_BH10PSE6_16820 [soil metagenome]
MATVPYIPSDQRVESPWGYVTRVTGGGVPPGYILAEAPGLSPRIIGPVATESFRMIRRVYAADNKIRVEFALSHPWLTGDSVTIRVYGADGPTHRAHRANNWEGGPLVEVGRLDPTSDITKVTIRQGGDPWTITKIDTATIELDGSVYKVNATDPDPVYLCGWAYSDEVDAWPAVEQAFEYIEGRPFSRIHFGVGVFMFLRNGGDLTATTWPALGGLEMPPYSTISGEGDNLSIFCRGDYFNATPFRTFHAGFTARDIGQIGNAMFNRLATHGWKATAESELRSVNDVTYRNLSHWAIPGYCFNNGHPGGKNRLRLENIKCFGSTNDFFDIKGEQTTNIDGAFGSSLENLFATAAGMGTVGSNNQAPVTLTTANPIGIVNGSGDFTVVLPFKPYVGQRIMLDAGTPAVGNFTLAGRGFTVKARGGTGATTATCNYDGSTVASAATGSYGGTGRTVLAPILNKGRPLFDLRSRGWRINNTLYIDVFGYSSGGRVRDGSGTNNNGTGGQQSVISNCVSISLATTGADTDGEAFKGFSVLGDRVQLRNFYVNGNGKGTGLSIQRGCDFSHFQGTVENCNIGVGWTASNVEKADLTVIGCATQVVVDGGNGTVVGVVSDALSITMGSSIVTVAWPDAPVGFLSGDTLLVVGAETIGGIVNPAGSWVVTKIGAGLFTFDSMQTATETTVGGGGSGIALTTGNVATPNSDNRLKLQSSGCTGTVIDFSRVAGFLLDDSSWDGSGTFAAYGGSVTGLLFGPNNRGIDCAMTFARLMSAANAGRGARAMISDSSVTAFWDTVAGGGANVRPVASDGTNWKVG